MTREQEKELYRIKAAMEKYDKAILTFGEMKQMVETTTAKEQRVNGYMVKDMEFPCYVKLDFLDFNNGRFVGVDREFIDMCLEYFTKKRKSLDDEYDAL